MSEREKTQSISSEISRVVTLYFSGIIVLLSFFFISSGTYFSLIRLFDDADNTLALHADYLAVPVIFDDREEIYRDLAGLVERIEVDTAVLFFLEPEDYLVETSLVQSESVNYDKDDFCKERGYLSSQFVVCQSILDNGQELAHLALAFTKKPIIDKLVFQLYIFSISMIVTLIFITYLVRKVTADLLKPLSELANVASQISQEEDYKYQVNVTSNNEIGLLAKSFNKMIAVIQQRNNKLKSHSQLLEKAVKERTASLELAVKEAEEANQSKSIFLTNMSHELRTPLHGILSFAMIGLKKHDTASAKKIAEYFQHIEFSGRRLLVLLNDLLDLAKLEAGKMELHATRTDLWFVSKECVEEQSALLKEKNISVDWSVSGNTFATFDSVRITQVITNILSNAIKFSPEHSQIHLDIHTEDINHNKMLKLTITDQGIGIPQSEIESVFDKFIQSSKTKTGAGGTGLGLAICKEILALHQGEIWCESDMDKGSRFMFTLPAE